MPSRLLALTFDAHDPARLAEFWGGVLGRAVVDDHPRGALLPGCDTQVGLRFVLSWPTSRWPAPSSRDRYGSTDDSAARLGRVPR